MYRTAKQHREAAELAGGIRDVAEDLTALNTRLGRLATRQDLRIAALKIKATCLIVICFVLGVVVGAGVVAWIR